MRIRFCYKVCVIDALSDSRARHFYVLAELRRRWAYEYIDRLVRLKSETNEDDSLHIKGIKL